MRAWMRNEYRHKRKIRRGVISRAPSPKIMRGNVVNSPCRTLTVPVATRTVKVTPDSRLCVKLPARATLCSSDEAVVVRQFVNDQIDRISNKLTARELQDMGPDLLSETILYLVLKSEAIDPIGPPSRQVDQMWHAFILCTNIYFKFCLSLPSARYLHHDSTLFVKGTETGRVAYYNVMRQYAERFGSSPPRKFWNRTKAGDEAIELGLLAVWKMWDVSL